MDDVTGRAPRSTASTGLPLALAILVAVFILVQIRARPPAPASSDAPGDEFSAGRARRILDTLVGDGEPHFVGTEANARVRARIVAHLEALGFEPDVQSAFTCGVNGACATVHNVLARVAGRDDARAVLLASHYDSVLAGPGASDAGVSVAAILEIARILRSDAPRRHPVILLIDDGEEAGLLGAQAFVEAHPWAREVGAVVNLEARGTSGQSFMFETSRDNAWLVRLLGRALRRPAASSLFYPVYERLPNDTDLTVFKRAGMPGVNFAFIGDLPKYHTPLDNAGNASATSLQHQGENALAMTRALADADLASPPEGNVVFFDVLGLGIVRWTARLTLPLAVAAAILLLACAWIERRRGAAPLWRAIVGVVGWLLAIGVSAIGAWGLGRLLARLGAFPGDATTSPSVAVSAFWLFGFALSMFVAAVFGRWTKRVGAWAGCWIAWSLAGIAAARLVPEAAYMFIGPALVAGLAGAAAVLARGTLAGWLPAVLPVVAAALVWMPPAWLIFHALGAPLLPVIGGAVAVLATGLAPLTADARLAWRWSVPAVSLVASLVVAWMAWPHRHSQPIVRSA